MRCLAGWCVCVALVVMLPTRGWSGETFYLKAMPSQRMFGPYEYVHGGTVTVGSVSFQIVRKLDVQAAPRHPAEERAAQAAAEQWLRDVDKADFGKAWDDASGFLKRALSRGGFEESMRTVQDTLGGSSGRSLSSAQYSDSLPGAPDGQYVVLEYTVVRERKERALESIITMRESDGKWRVAGYHVR
ncbi:MAG: DUF4019 domain-containing protein [Lentisphaerae bacterium]|nr:DUF4019 domain-containing protein [Lentisphaerota bacterium]